MFSSCTIREIFTFNLLGTKFQNSQRFSSCSLEHWKICFIFRNFLQNQGKLAVSWLLVKGFHPHYKSTVLRKENLYALDFNLEKKKLLFQNFKKTKSRPEYVFANAFVSCLHSTYNVQKACFIYTTSIKLVF